MRKIATVQRHDLFKNWSKTWSEIVCLANYCYSKKYYKIIAIDLSKYGALDAVPKQYSKLVLLKV